jgi:hypothetical protein
MSNRGPGLQRVQNRDKNPHNADETEFLIAIAHFKKMGRPFPTWSEALAVLVSLGYRKVAPKAELPRPKEA